MSAMTPGELRVLAASVIGIEPDTVQDVAMVVLTRNGEFGLTGTSCCEPATASILAGGIARIMASLHAREEVK